RLGNAQEKAAVLDALLERGTTRGLSGVVAMYAQLPDELKLLVLRNIRKFHEALRECGRSDDEERRLAAMKLIALGRQGKLAYVLSENLHESDEKLAQAACEAMVALARWASTETRALQRGSRTEDGASRIDDGAQSTQPSSILQPLSSYLELI